MDYQAHCAAEADSLTTQQEAVGMGQGTSRLSVGGDWAPCGLIGCSLPSGSADTAASWTAPGVTEACEAAGHSRHSVHMPNAQSRVCRCRVGTSRGLGAAGSACCAAPGGLRRAICAVACLQDGHMGWRGGGLEAGIVGRQGIPCPAPTPGDARTSARRTASARATAEPRRVSRLSHGRGRAVARDTTVCVVSQREQTNVICPTPPPPPPGPHQLELVLIP